MPWLWSASDEQVEIIFEVLLYAWNNVLSYTEQLLSTKWAHKVDVQFQRVSAITKRDRQFVM